MVDNRKVIDLPIDDILPNRYQPRIKFDDTAIFELSESIKNHGVFQPIIVRPIGDKYEIIAGERRYKASVLANKKTIPAIIMNLNDKDTIEIALIENVQRANLTPIEEAISYRKILDMGYIKQEDLARKLGKTQSTIANKLRLLNLDEDVQEALLENKISERHARSLLRIKNINDQKIMLKRIINERLTVRKTDEEIDKMINNDNNTIIDNPVAIDNSTSPIFGVEEVVQEVSTPSVVEETNPTSIFGFSNFGTENIETVDTIEEPVVNNSTVISSEPAPVIAPVEASQIDINAVQTEATPLFEEKPVANMDDFLKSDTPVGPIEDVQIQEPTGKFFDFTSAPEPVVETVENKSNFNFDNLFKPETTIPVTPIETPIQNVESTIAQPIEETTSTPLEFNNFINVDNTQSVEPTIENVVTPIANEIEEPVISNFENPIEQSVENVTTVEEPVIPIMPTIEEEPIIPSVAAVEEEPVIPTPEINTGSKNIMKAVNIIRDAVEELNRLGYMVDVDEIDLESMYQLIIKIDK